MQEGYFSYPLKTSGVTLTDEYRTYLLWNPIAPHLIRPTVRTLVCVSREILTTLAALHDYLCTITGEEPSEYRTDTHGSSNSADNELILLVESIHRKPGVFDLQTRQRLTFEDD
jgi:hypothetical protein